MCAGFVYRVGNWNNFFLSHSVNKVGNKPNFFVLIDMRDKMLLFSESKAHHLFLTHNVLCLPVWSIR